MVYNTCDIWLDAGVNIADDRAIKYAYNCIFHQVETILVIHWLDEIYSRISTSYSTFKKIKMVDGRNFSSPMSVLP